RRPPQARRDRSLRDGSGGGSSLESRRPGVDGGSVLGLHPLEHREDLVGHVRGLAVAEQGLLAQAGELVAEADTGGRGHQRRARGGARRGWSGGREDAWKVCAWVWNWRWKAARLLPKRPCSTPAAKSSICSDGPAVAPESTRERAYSR